MSNILITKKIILKQKNMKKTILISLFLVLNLLLFGQNTKKDKFDDNRLYKGKLSNEDFFNKADYIFEGEYIKSEAYFVDDSTKVYTQYLLRVNEVYKGSKKLEKGTVTLIKNSGFISKIYENENGEVVIFNKDHNNDNDFYVQEKQIFFCLESDLTQSLNSFEASNNIILKLFSNHRFASLIYDDDLLDEYNFLVSGLNSLYFKDKYEFYNYAKQFEGVKIPKEKKKKIRLKLKE